jgi:uncharacterized repeat protein (TIGR03803 family)
MRVRMQRSERLSILAHALLLVALATAVLASAQSTETVLHAFSFNKDGGMPYAGLTFDKQGNLYGVAYYAGSANEGICCGSVFQLTPNTGGWNFNVLYDFKAPITQGEAPSGSVVFDGAGNLYGTTQEGGYCGNVYELSPTHSGPWKETIIHLFNNYKQGVFDDGCLPSSYLIFDKAGNLYGTTQQTGFGGCTPTANCGTVFQLSPGTDGMWKETIIHNFPQDSSDGTAPFGGLVFDQAGNLWGTTPSGGTAGLGTIFELAPAGNGTWSETVAFNFTSDTTGWQPLAGLVVDGSGNLYGTTYQGGTNGVGLVFKMTPQTDGHLTQTIIHEFAGCTATECPDGLNPFGGLIFDASGNLYGTTTYGGAAGTTCNAPDSNVRVGCGIIFKLTPASHDSWKYSIVHRFPGGADGAFPTDDHLAVDSKGNVFGTTFVEGDVNDSMCPQVVLGLAGCGIVFEVTP